MELFHANRQWATRPADQRFRTLPAMLAATQAYAKVARTTVVPWSDLRVEATDNDLLLKGKKDTPATLTHYAFGQLSARVGAPPHYLRELPPTLAAQNLNHGLKHGRSEGAADAQLLFHTNGALVLRAATTEQYERIWNWEVIERLMEACDQHTLVPARPTFSWTGEKLDDNREAALYASDHDMFAFVMSKERGITDGTGRDLYRGFIVINSEVGARSLGILRFYFRDVCGNFIIWGAEKVIEVRMQHRGQIRQKWDEALVQVRQYMDGSGSLDEARIKRAIKVKLGATKQDVLDRLFGIRSLGLSRKMLDASYEAVLPEQDGSPLTQWGLVQGMTRHAQATPYADERQDIDRKAGRVLSIEF